jgi:hypothetical protein
MGRQYRPLAAQSCRANLSGLASAHRRDRRSLSRPYLRDCVSLGPNLSAAHGFAQSAAATALGWQIPRLLDRRARRGGRRRLVVFRRRRCVGRAALVASAIAAANAGALDLLSLAPRQELQSFAERLVMPCGPYLLAFCQDLPTAARLRRPGNSCWYAALVTKPSADMRQSEVQFAKT